jgi:hypothetical protein
MSTPAADPATTVPSEVTGLVTAQTYAAAMTRAYTDIAEQTAQFAAGLGSQGVDGPAVAAVTRAQDATAAAGAAWAQATTALHRQTTVREAYTATPEAGGKAFITSTEPAAAGGADQAEPQRPDGARVEMTITGADGAHAQLSLAASEAWELYRAVALAIVRVEHPQLTDDGCPEWCFDDHTAGDTTHTGEFDGPAWYETTGAQAIVRPELTAGGVGQLRLAVTGIDGAHTELVLAVTEANDLLGALGDAAQDSEQEARS